jgi:hypothetical protein
MRSRQTERAAITLVAISIGAWLWGRWLGCDEGALCVALVLFPLFAGGILGVVTASPFGELERTASRPLIDLRAIQTKGLLAIAAVGLLAATWTWQIDGARELTLRNLSGFAGLSLLAAVLIGGRLAWIGPVAYGLGSYAMIADGNNHGWVLPFQPAGSDLAAAVAVSVLLGGLVLISLRGPHETSNEAI